jgi:predicted nucleotidyltransferase
MGDEIIRDIVYKYKWDDIDIFEVIYPEAEVADKLEQICIEKGWEVKKDILNTIASSCNSVRSAMLTLDRYINKGKLGKVIPIDIQGSQHEQIRKVLTGHVVTNVDIDYSKFLDYCLTNKVPAVDVESFIMLSYMAKQKRLAGVDESFRNVMRATNEVILPPRVKAKVYAFIPREKKEKKEKEEKWSYTKNELQPKISVRKTNTSLNDIW